LAERIGISLNLVDQLLAHAGRAVHRIEQRVDLVEELPPHGGAPRQPVFGFVAAHGQERDHELPGVLVGHPGQVLPDDRLDGGAGAIEPAADPVGLGEPEIFPLPLQGQEVGLRGRDALVEGGQCGALGLAHRAFDRAEILSSLFGAGVEGRDRVLVRTRDEIPFRSAWRRARP
jgi:hypothetical protein